MTVDPILVERIYEAAVLPDRWPGVLETIADRVGVVGATIVTQGADRVSIIPAPRIERIVADYLAAGWANDPVYAAPCLPIAIPDSALKRITARSTRSNACPFTQNSSPRAG